MINLARRDWGVINWAGRVGGRCLMDVDDV